jgi:centractin
VLSLYASGRTTGIVLDSGDGVSHAVPVYEGFSMASSIRRIDVAGRDVTEYLQTLLRKAGYVFHTSAEKEIVRQIKESACYIALNPRQEEKEWISGSKPDESKVFWYTLPDGKKIKVCCVSFFRPPYANRTSDQSEREKSLGVARSPPKKLTWLVQLGQERFRAPEILFDPEIIGLEYPGVHQLIVDAISRADMDLRKHLYSNIVLSGGSTLTRDFGNRLLSELQRLAVKDMKIKISAPKERKYSTWIGGSILAQLSTFRKVSFSIFSCLLTGPVSAGWLESLVVGGIKVAPMGSFAVLCWRWRPFSLLA